MSSNKSAIIALALASIIWGATAPIMKLTLAVVPVFTLAFLRFGTASLLLLPFVLKKLAIKEKDWPLVIAAAILGVTLNISFFFLGLKNAPSINAPIIASSGPIILILGSIFFLHEKPKKKVLLGTFISLIGVLIIIARPLFEAGFDLTAVIGNFYFVIATIAAVIHTLLAKELSSRYSALVISFWSFLIGSLSFFPLFWQETYSHGPIILDIRGITGLVFGIFLSSTLAYSIYHWAIKQISASEVGVFTYIDPVVATVIALPLLKEVITPLFILGSFFVFSGIFVAEGRIHYHPFHHLRNR